MTQVYVFCRGAEPLDAALAAVLPRWRRERWEKISHPSARQECLSVGLLYAYALKQWGLARETPVQLLPAGKPVFVGEPEVYFSLSHGGEWVACALSHQTVGVDVQPVRPVNLSILRRFHPQEREWLRQQPRSQQEEEFFRLWTRKESWVKAQSRERMVSLDEVDVIHSLTGWQFRDFCLAPQVPMALCGPVLTGEETFCVVERQRLLAALS